MQTHHTNEGERWGQGSRGREGKELNCEVKVAFWVRQIRKTPGWGLGQRTAGGKLDVRTGPSLG